MAEESLLSKTHKFIVLAPDEYIWLFQWESKPDLYGETVWGWQAYFKRPGSMFLATQSMWGEKEVYNFLVKNNHKLDEDDKLDLLLFLYKGGLEEFFKTIKRKDADSGRGFTAS